MKRVLGVATRDRLFSGFSGFWPVEKEGEEVEVACTTSSFLRFEVAELLWWLPFVFRMV